MKLLLFVILVFTTGSSLVQGQSIRDIIDEYIQSLKNLIPEPVNLPDINVTPVENDYISTSVSLTNGILGGLREFDVQVDYRGIIIPIPTGFTITLRNLNLYEDFFSAIQLRNSTVLGYNIEGSFNTISTDVVIKGELDFTIIPLNFSVTSLSYNVGGIEFRIQGILNERFSDLLSQILTNHVASAINRLSEPISSILVNIINSIIDDIFSNIYSLNPDNVFVEESKEKSMEQLRQFFKILNIQLGLEPSGN